MALAARGICVVVYISRRVDTLARCISGLAFSMQAEYACGVWLCPVRGSGEGAASDSDLLESSTSDILSDAFTS